MNSLSRARTEKLIELHIEDYHVARAADDGVAAWTALETTHILAQPYLWLHLGSHGRMLRYALARRDAREVIGQLFRLFLVPLGTISGRLPVGNTGRARVSAFQPMPIPRDLLALITEFERPEREPTP